MKRKYFTRYTTFILGRVGLLVYGGPILAEWACPPPAANEDFS